MSCGFINSTHNSNSFSFSSTFSLLLAYFFFIFRSMMSIQGQTLEVTVAGCSRLKDTKWVSKQKPYVSIEYGGSRFLSSISTGGGTNPNFQEKNRIILIEGLRELNVAVWSSNTMTYDNLIGNGRVQLKKVLSEGFDDTAWTIQSQSSRYAGEVCLVMHYSNANKPMTGCASPGPQYFASPAPQCCAAPHPPQPQTQQVPLYYATPLASAAYPPPYAPQAYAYQAFPPQPYPPHGYQPNPHQAYPPQN